MRVTYIKFFFTAVLLTVITGSCTKEYESIETEDEKNIQEYIRKNSLNVQQYDTTGIYYQILTEGTGEEVDYTDRVFITLQEKSIDGQYSSASEFSNIYTNYLGYLGPELNLPEAYRISVKEILKRKGGSIRVIVPSRLAYGKAGSGDIPGNASLDCTLTLYNADNGIEFEDGLINRFAEVNNLSLTKDSSGVHYQIINPGTGSEQFTDSTEITVSYTLRFLGGEVFQETTASDPFKSKIADNINGFQIGVRLLKKGGKIRLFLPSRLAYGTRGVPPNIPPNTILDYDIELLEVTN